MAARRLPLGYRFKPTKIQLLRYFLTNKLSGQPLSNYPILEHDVYSDHPSNILEKNEGSRAVQLDEKGVLEGYFFTRLKKTITPDGKYIIRHIEDHGTWLGNSKTKSVVVNEATKVIGYEGYYKFKPKDVKKNEPENMKEWKRHEYSLSLNNNELVLCHITNQVESFDDGDTISRAVPSTDF